MSAAVLKLDVNDLRTSMLIPMAAKRIEQHAAQYQPEAKPAEYARAAIARLWNGDPRVLLLAIVEPTTVALLGHVLAELVMFGTQPSAIIAQVRADENVGDALVKAVEQAIEWAEAAGVSRDLIFLHTRDGRDWEKRLGFKRYRSIMRLPLAVENGNGNGGADGGGGHP